MRAAATTPLRSRLPAGRGARTHAQCQLLFPTVGMLHSSWGRMVSCGRVVLGLVGICILVGRPIDNRPQVANLPHIKPRARLNQYRCPVVGECLHVASSAPHNRIVTRSPMEAGCRVAELILKPPAAGIGKSIFRITALQFRIFRWSRRLDWRARGSRQPGWFSMTRTEALLQTNRVARTPSFAHELSLQGGHPGGLCRGHFGRLLRRDVRRDRYALFASELKPCYCLHIIPLRPIREIEQQPCQAELTDSNSLGRAQTELAPSPVELERHSGSCLISVAEKELSFRTTE